MFKFSRKISLHALGLVMLLVGLIPLNAYSANKLILTLNLQEYTYPAGRTGTIKVYQPDATSPFANNPNWAVYNTGLWVTTNWGSLGHCNSSFLAGGLLNSWLLGPVTDIPTIRQFHPTATVAYGMFPGQLGDNGNAVRYDCTGAAIPDTNPILLVFLLPQPEYWQGQSYHIGDVWYSTDLNPSGNWYYVIQ